MTARTPRDRLTYLTASALGALAWLVPACSSDPGAARVTPGDGTASSVGGSAGVGQAGNSALPTAGTAGAAVATAGAGGMATATGGTATATGGAATSSGGTGATTGGMAAMTGGAGGSTAGAATGGADPGAGGMGVGAGGMGGSSAGMGGSAGGMGGSSAGTGGSSAGMGGSSAGMGGSSAGMGGSSDTGGELGPDLTDPNSFTAATCTTTPMVTTASAIPSVGIATFTTDLAGADSAVIQFGKTADYSLEAPVNWGESDHRTLILGVPANTEVHYRVVVFAGDSACTGPDATFQTGGTVNGAPGNQTPTMGPSSASVAPGFIIAENGSFAYIVNKQGEVVWAHRFPVNLSRALMSWDGMYMYGREVGPFNSGSGGAIYRVGMDGEGEMQLPVTGGTHHDVVATPTGIAYPAKEQSGACDCIFTADADGSNSSCLVDLEVVFSHFNPGPGGAAMEECHVNAIRYYDDTKSFSVSDREKDAIAFFTDTGELLGSVGAQPASSTPNHALAEGADSTTNATWRVQHGHDWYAPDKLVVWSNGAFQGGQSKILHYTINGTTATLDWQYTGTGNSPTLSDAQHLPNGNFLATNSQSGAVHEIDSQQMLVQSFNNLSRGYSSHRTTLYGRPPGR